MSTCAQALWLARYEYAAGRSEAALGAAERAVGFDPKAVEARFLVGMISEERGDLASAVGAYAKTVQLDKRHFKALNNIARIYATSNDTRLKNAEVAVGYAERANEICEGTNPVVLDTLARALAGRGRIESALEAARAAATLAPEDENIAAFLAELQKRPRQ